MASRGLCLGMVAVGVVGAAAGVHALARPEARLMDALMGACVLVNVVMAVVWLRRLRAARAAEALAAAAAIVNGRAGCATGVGSYRPAANTTVGRFTAVTPKAAMARLRTVGDLTDGEEGWVPYEAIYRDARGQLWVRGDYPTDLAADQICVRRVADGVEVTTPTSGPWPERRFPPPGVAVLPVVRLVV